MSVPHYIYQIIDAAGAVRYVGKSRHPYKRLFGHINDSRRDKRPFYRWLKEVMAAGHFPDVRIVSLCEKDDLKAERAEVQRCLLSGHPVMNVSYSMCNTVVSISIEQENLKDAKNLAKEQERTLSQIFDFALREYLAKNPPKKVVSGQTRKALVA